MLESLTECRGFARRRSDAAGLEHSQDEHPRLHVCRSSLHISSMRRFAVLMNFYGLEISELFMYLQLGRIYMDMLNVYKVTSVNIDMAIKNCGESATRQPLIKLMRGVKKDTLKLIASLVQRANDATMVPTSSIALRFTRISTVLVYVAMYCTSMYSSQLTVTFSP